MAVPGDGPRRIVEDVDVRRHARPVIQVLLAIGDDIEAVPVMVPGHVENGGAHLLPQVPERFADMGTISEVPSNDYGVNRAVRGNEATMLDVEVGDHMQL